MIRAAKREMIEVELQILSEKALTYFKDTSFIEANINKFQNYQNNEWLTEAFGESPFIESKYSFDDLHFEMTAPEKKESTTEFENVKEVYYKMKSLNDSNASEEKIWAGLCLSDGYHYTQYRWKSQLDNVEGIKSHFFFNAGNRRAYTRNAMARLWWIGRLTYDEKNPSDPWHLTKFVCMNSDLIMHFLERTTSNNITILRPFLSAIIEAKDAGMDINTTDAGNLEKQLDILGASYSLDFMSEQWIKEKTKVLIREYIDKKNSEANIPTEIVSVNNQNDVDSSENDGLIKPSDRVVLRRKTDGQFIIIKAKGNGFRLKPSSLVGLRVGDPVVIGKYYYEITGIK